MYMRWPKGSAGPRSVRQDCNRSSLRARQQDCRRNKVATISRQYSKINAADQWIERTERVSLNDLFEKCPLKNAMTARNRKPCRRGSKPQPKMRRRPSADYFLFGRAREASVSLECSFPFVPLGGLLVHTSPSKALFKRALTRELGCLF
jgi:hypothetical protein